MCVCLCVKKGVCVCGVKKGVCVECCVCVRGDKA